MDSQVIQVELQVCSTCWHRGLPAQPPKGQVTVHRTTLTLHRRYRNGYGAGNPWRSWCPVPQADVRPFRQGVRALTDLRGS